MLLANVTALDVAFVSAVLGGLVGLASPLSTWLVSKSQRQAELNARVYRDKRDAYHAVARDVYRGRELLGQCADDLAKADDARARELVSQLEQGVNALNRSEPETLTLLIVVASNRVRDARDAFVDVWNEVVGPLWKLDAEHPGYVTAANATLGRALETLGPAIAALRDAMRDDLCN